jgi:DNA-binding HxlR family transcriptional regulator
LKLRRFGEILRNNPGLTARVLSRRLAQMQREGLVKKKHQSAQASKNDSGYFLTPKGEDAIYILLAILRYGLRHYTKEKIEDKSDE